MRYVVINKTTGDQVTVTSDSCVPRVRESISVSVKNQEDETKNIEMSGTVVEVAHRLSNVPDESTVIVIIA